MFVTIGNTPSKKGQLSLIFLFLDFHAHSRVSGTNKSKFQIKNKNGRVGLPYDTSYKYTKWTQQAYQNFKFKTIFSWEYVCEKPQY